LNDSFTHFFSSPRAELIGRWLLGIVFLTACFHKILNPAQFAKILYGYQLVPNDVINLTAIVLPFLEGYAGLALMLGIYPKSAALLINTMLIAFIVAISINLLRGHEFDCGCFSIRNTQGPSAAVTLLVRDVICLMGGIYIMAFRGTRKGCLVT
jgi:uncharacterized membrane protein YphA (DoxX/SURF4 family)